MDTIKNKVQLTGNLGAAPEVKSFENGRKMARFSIAANEFYKNAKGEKVSNTHWYNMVAWGKTADYAEQFLKKGMEVAIDGKLQTRNYTDKAGLKRYVTEVQVNEIMIVTEK